MKPAVRIVLAPIARRGARRSDPAFEAPLQGQAVGRVITIDPRVPLPHKVLLHELTHVRHPDWDEDRVRAYEELRWTRMSWRRKAELLRLLATAQIEGE